MLNVEVVGVGGGDIYVLSVQQPGQSWTVYRSVTHFQNLCMNLSSLLPNITPFPSGGLGPQAIPGGFEMVRNAVQQWLGQILLVPGIVETPFMQEFLTAEANLPPPGIEIAWVKQGHKSSMDDMEMELDELFDRHLDDKEGDFEEERVYVPGSAAAHHPMGGVAGEASTPMSASACSMSAGNGGWHPEAPGVAHSFTQRNGLEEFDGDASDFEGEEAEIMPESLPSEAHSSFMSSAADGRAGRDERARYTLDSFKILQVIGKGSFGKVFLVRENVSGQIYAMKVLRKENIIKRNQVEHTRTERSVLGYVRHRFIVGLNMAFQTSDKLFFVLDYCAGGELFFHLGKLTKFPEVRARFYAAEISLALAYVHKLDIVYRDLKPENVLLDGEGHVRLTDFGLSKEGITNNTSGANSFCGTPEYLAPEILNRQVFPRPGSDAPPLS